MKTINTYYKSKKIFESFVFENNLKDEKNLLIQVFSSQLDKEIIKKIRDEILNVLPNTTIIGATTDGEILDTHVTTDSVVVSVSYFAKSSVVSASIDKNGLSDYEMGNLLAKKLISKKTKLLILFADGLHTNGEEFLNGVNSLSSNIMVAGGLAADGASFSGTTVFTDDAIVTNGAVGVAIDSDVLSVYNNYNFGWQQIGPVMEVTKSDKNVVYEIDGKSAYDIYAYYLGESTARSLPAIGIEFPLIILKDSLEIARAVLSKNDDKSLVFAGNVLEGSKVQLGYGDAKKILDNNNIYIQSLSNSAQSIFIYSCMARRRFLESNISIELNAHNSKTPISGFFTNGEFYKNANRCELLNQTMTRIFLSEDGFEDTLDTIEVNPTKKILDENTTISALSHLISVTSKELKNANELLEKNLDKKTNQLQEKVIELEKVTQAKSDFLANMSHEIRTPLNAITGFIDIIRENEQNKKNIEHLDIVKSSSNLLLNIINDILDISKIESGQLEIEYIDFDLKKLIKEINLLFYQKTKEKNIHQKIHYDINAPEFINGDPVRFKQVALNLISNAIKFTPEGGDIRISLHYDKKENAIVFELKDSGIGIDEKNIEKIFKPFSQEDSSTTRKFGGTGLGLTISSNLVKLMGGELKVKSKLGVGSTFYFSLPIKKNIKNIATTKHYKNDVKFSGKILVVEDNKPNQMFMNVLLKKLELTNDIANDGVEAIEMFKNNQYDLILMDENMPNMNGIEATKHILQHESQNLLKHTPIIALTANALKGDRERFLNAGMDEYLTKPVNKKRLIEIFGRFLNEK